ncbi:hypothetical protein RUM43_009281 [Polyplax serrata]|uniref:Tubulin glycylase 3A n=1 Tax=Polyplax serrata TaxID=468196 RepID=A0AAN8PW53_POLSC
MSESENAKRKKNILENGQNHIKVGQRDNEKGREEAGGQHATLRILIGESERQDDRKRSTKGRRKSRLDGFTSSVDRKPQVDKVTDHTSVSEQWGITNRVNLKCDSPPRRSFIEAITSEKSSRSIERKSLGNLLREDDVKLTKSDCRKIHINEILKGHAQKVQAIASKSCVQVKDRPVQLTTEPLQKVRNTQSADYKAIPELKVEPLMKKKKDVLVEDNVRNDEPKTNRKSDQGTKIEDITNAKEPPPVTKLDGIAGGKRNSEVVQAFLELELRRKKKEVGGDGAVEDTGKKTVVNEWMSHPQSSELKNRLQGTWKNDLSFQEYVTVTSGDNQAVKPIDDDSKKEKRRTYTDRVVVLKSAGKLDRRDPDERKSYKETKIRTQDLHLEGKQLSLPPPNPLVTPLSPSLFKPKVTKSAELRDLVNHAVRGMVRSDTGQKAHTEEEASACGTDSRPREIPYGRTSELQYDTIEAILAAKELFVNELEETVTKSVPLKSAMDKSRMSLVPVIPAKKISDLSVKESDSLFRITPPTSDKKVSNFEIREFVVKCQTAAQKKAENEKKETKEKSTGKTGKKTKETGKHSKKESEEKVSEPTPLALGLQTMLETVGEGKKTIRQAIAEKTAQEAPAEKSTKQENTEKKNENADGKKPVELPKVVYTEGDSKAISKIIQSTNAKIHFMWLSIKPAIHLKCFNYSPEIINKFQRTTFCTKIGLWNHLNNIQWYANEVHSPAKSPRMYNTGEADDLQAFFQDFQLTACIGMLKWLADTFFDKGIKAVQTRKGKVPLRAFEFAIKQCERYMKFKDNEDLSAIDEPKPLQDEWNTFLQWFYTIANDHGKLQESSSAQLMVVYTKAVEILRVMRKYCPEIDIDGRLNMWIMKPYCASCGRGIFLTNNVYYIGQHSKYIVQKYIEKPFLIYNTKFDIRQWFMITKLTPLEIWMYKECYLRFCTQPFALRNLHESVHLSNNSVQRKYVNRFDTSLFDQNMWDSATFQMYLSSIGHPNVWNEVIYPGMKDAIVSVMLSAQDNFDGPRKNWFEVYGADFMLSSNVKDGPWLIEINENPAMDPSTKVTARLCPQMLRDVIKVVVDKRADKSASTGQWELIYRQNYSPSFATVDLDVKGRKIPRISNTIKADFITECQASDYEVVQSLSEGEKLKVEPPKKIDPLILLKKEHEMFRHKCEFNNARELIDKVIQDDKGKSLRISKNPSSRTCNEPPLMLKLRNARNPPKDDSNRFNFKGNEMGRAGELRFEYASTRNEMDPEDKYKFTKFYKI